ncbi:hypothetical protein CCR85_14415 [Rhodothalassium salexigens]|uniref:DUF2849 domain-containing protein n=1 Tax=Rhodothalassium salexigens TaxID=1086 RepID=UPI00191397BB|nr:DUF2849 domain-containing protein [Rhodothalassium salexigens]MBK5912674.1 hypothetical protein [Rhodothalassium salexigens]MBK5920253.1 hypothetical protein [Rhodothalassium salexigens]
MPKKKPQGPWIVTANDLLTGRVVFLTAAGDWQGAAGQAAVAYNDDMADYLMDRAQADAVANLVVEPALIGAVLDADDRPRPARNREAIRATGPTVRRDLGYQSAN